MRRGIRGNDELEKPFVGMRMCLHAVIDQLRCCKALPRKRESICPDVKAKMDSRLRRNDGHVIGGNY
jgi:hypothetical protein